MSRVKSSVQAKARANKIYKRAKGFQGTTKSTLARKVLRAGAFSTAHNKRKKTDFKAVRIIKINAACRAYGLKYSEFVNLIKKANYNLNTKTLAQIAVLQPSLIGFIISEASKK